MKKASRRQIIGSALIGVPAVLYTATSSSQESRYLGFDVLSTVRLDATFYPVRFWSIAATDLVALDHSIPPNLSVGPGPGGSSLALGLVHAVIADAVIATLQKPEFKALLKTNKAEPIASVPAFVGGAAFDILRFIFNGQRHEPLLIEKARLFLSSLGGESVAIQSSWGAGQSFANDPAFRSKWDQTLIRKRTIDDANLYKPEAGKHDVDPWNPGQSFYGVTWGEHTPIVLTKDEARADGALAPPTPPAITPQEISLLRAKGGLNPVDIGGVKARTESEEDVGLFWAYDGARLLGTPPVLYNEILWQYVDATQGMSLEAVARLFALCNLAMADASIVAWGSKYLHKVWRPVRAIVDQRIDENWHPLGSPRTNSGAAFPNASFLGAETAQVLLGASRQSDFQALANRAPAPMELRTGRRGIAYAQAAFTPNFPAYPSGHATFGGACFGMLARIRKERLVSEEAANRLNLRRVRSGELNRRYADPTISLDNFDGRPREEVLPAFRTINDLIEANDQSRLYLGVHWTFDSTEGSASGRRIAERVHSRAYAPVV